MDNNTDRRLDRIVRFDERSRNYRAVEGIEDAPLVPRTWFCDTYNDQGREGACVGFALSHEAAAKPVQIPTDDAWALSVYHRARQLDPWEGEDYDGTSVLAGVQAVQEIKNRFGNPLIKEYRWAFGLEDVVRTIGYLGPVVFGINWYENMYHPDENEFIHAEGQVVGGHAIMGKGVNLVFRRPTGKFSDLDLDRSSIRLHNSWGRGYGKKGDALISLTDMAKLLRENGEAVIPIKRAVK